MDAKVALDDQLKIQYKGFIESAQQVEVGIGSAQYKLYTMCKMRENLDNEMRKWWDIALNKYNLDKNRDYFVDNEGFINQVGDQASSPEPASKTDDAVSVNITSDTVASELM